MNFPHFAAYRQKWLQYADRAQEMSGGDDGYERRASNHANFREWRLKT
jgi:hypothetical protein